MERDGFQCAAGAIAIAAGALALLSPLVGLAAVGWAFEVFSDPSALIGIGAARARWIAASFALDGLGNYLLLLPLILALDAALRGAERGWARLGTLGGVLYAVLGALGSAVLGAAWPFLIGAYEQAPAAERAGIALQFGVVSAIAQGGLHGAVQNTAAVLWFGSLAPRLRAVSAPLSACTGVLCAALALNALGDLLGLESLALPGLLASVGLAPLWSIWTGGRLLRGPLETESVRDRAARSSTRSSRS